MSRSTSACFQWLCTIILLHHVYSPVYTSSNRCDLLPAKLFLAETCLSLSHVQAADMSICMISLCASVCACAFVHVKVCNGRVDESIKAHGGFWLTMLSPYPILHHPSLFSSFMPFLALKLVIAEISVDPDVTLLIPFNLHPHNAIEEVLKETRQLIRTPVN